MAEQGLTGAAWLRGQCSVYESGVRNGPWLSGGWSQKQPAQGRGWVRSSGHGHPGPLRAPSTSRDQSHIREARGDRTLAVPGRGKSRLTAPLKGEKAEQPPPSASLVKGPDVGGRSERNHVFPKPANTLTANATDVGRRSSEPSRYLETIRPSHRLVSVPCRAPECPRPSGLNSPRDGAVREAVEGTA